MERVRMTIWVMVASFVVTLWACQSAVAASRVWDGDGPGNDWSTPTNWSNNLEPTSTDDALITNGGWAIITQYGEVCNQIYIDQDGTVEMTSGSLTAEDSWQRIGYNGRGTFTQSGGSATFEYFLYLGDQPGSTGTYNLSGTGQLSAIFESVGRKGTGIFNQTGGTNTGFSALRVGFNPGSNGTYDMSGGELWGGSVYVGSGAGSVGTFSISGGRFNPSGLVIGGEGEGAFNILSGGAQITVGTNLHFRSNSAFTAVPGSTIRMGNTGAQGTHNFYNENTNPSDLAGLSNLTLVFESGDPSLFEVSGAINGGFSDNFALGGLVLGGSDVGIVQLVDNYDNGNRGSGPECLFLHELAIGENSSLDLNGLSLFVEGDVENLLDVWINDGRLTDSTLPPTYLDAVYVSEQNWTVVSGPTKPPVADADGPYIINVGDTLTLDASGSVDEDNDITSYMWDLDDDETFETDAGDQEIFDVNYAYLQSLGLLVNHTYTIHLQVTDSEGQSDVNESTLRIEPKPALWVAVDVKPGSCPNPLNVKSSGVLPIAILGTEDVNVITIDPTSIRLAGIEPLRSGYEDVAGPVSDSNDCNCITEGPDGFLDLTLKFKTQRIVEAIGDVNDGDVLELPLTGVLSDETPIDGADCILIRGRYKPINRADINKDGVVDAADFAILAENWLQSSIVED